MSLAVWMLALVPQQVDGLRSGESVSSVSRDPVAHVCPRGRLIDGTSGAPIAGADVEWWSEPQNLTAALLGKSSSRADGSFVGTSVPFGIEGEPKPDKVIVRASGYRSTCATSSDASEIRLLPISKHLGLRVTDLDGNPIAGARAESRQTCAHAPPAFVGTSNVAGVFDVSTFPPLDDEPELVVSARGYGAVLLQIPELMLAPGGMEVRLPKRKPLAFQLVDSKGAALARRDIHVGEEPRWCTAQSDSEGRVAIDSTFFGRDFHLTVRDGGTAGFLAAGRAPISVEPKLTYYDLAERKLLEPDPSPGVAVHVVDAAGQALDLPVVAIPEKGTTPDGLEGVRKLREDWGRTTLIAGGPFTGWKESVTVLDKPVETTLIVAREPVLTIQLPADAYWLVHVQAGDDSITLDGPKFPLQQPVPAGKAITICAVNEKETRLARLGHIAEDRTVDLTRTASLLEPARTPEPAVAHRWLVDEPELGGHVRVATGQIEWSDLHGAVEFAAEPRASFEALVGAKDCVPCSIGPWNAAETSFRLPHRASLTVRGATLVAVCAGGEQGEELPGVGFTVSDLAPGPLLVELVQKNFDVVTLSLVLESGEQRELTLR